MSYDPNNVFAKILSGEIPSPRIYEDDNVIAINDIQPAARVHILVIPKQPVQTLADFLKTSDADTIAHFFHSIRTVAIHVGLDDSGYRIVINTGADAGQTVPHLHAHILGGEKLSEH